MPHPSNVLLMFREAQPGRGRLLRAKLPTKPERLEARTLLNADPIQFGGVYTERDLGSDASPDTIEVSFIGGAPGTQLKYVQLDGDKFAPGLSLADMLFDTLPSGIGADDSFDGLVTDRIGEFTASISVQDGSSQLLLELDGFEAGEKLVLSIDVDEMQGFEPDLTDVSGLNDELDPIASGAEFQGTTMTAAFSAPHYYDTEATVAFQNRYDDQLDGTGLNLPLDDEHDNRDRTAGAVGHVVQSPLPISIAGRVYEDRDANLQFDGDDRGIKDVELALFVLEGEQYVHTGHTQISDAAGNYSFDAALGLSPGIYEIRESQPADYFSVGAVPGWIDGRRVGQVKDSDTLTQIEIPLGGSDGVQYDFAEAQPASIHGSVHLSTNEADCFAAGVDHQPVVGATVLLLDEQGRTVAETTTDSEGDYSFLDLRPGTYTVVEVTPPDLFEGGARAGRIDGIVVGTAGESRVDDIRLASGDQAVNYDFCEHPPARLSGHVFHDRDNDGLRAVGEEGIADALLSLLDETGTIVDTVETDSAGRYEFVGIKAGNYRVIELQPTGWRDGRDRAGTVDGLPVGQALNPGDEIRDITLGWGSEGVDYDFGELRPARLEGRVHLSTPEGDCWDLDESLLEPVAGAVVQLLNANGQVVAETVTDTDGSYFFDDLEPAEYSVRELTPSHLRDGGAHAGQVDGDTRGVVQNGVITGVRLDSSEQGTRYDFCEFAPSRLSGHVYEDQNNNQTRDVGESPIAGVTLELLDEQQNRIATTQTDALGRYAFTNLDRGLYAIRQLQPDGYLDGHDHAGTVDGERRGVAVNPGDQIEGIQLNWNEVGIDFDFGELRPASLSGRVHSSAEADCWNDETAEPLAGVTIQLFDGVGRFVAQTETNSTGYYRFDNLLPGTYEVVETQPTTVFQGGQRAGSHGGRVDQQDRITEIELAAGDNAVEYDFCEVPPGMLSGFVFLDGPPIQLAPGETLPEDIAPLRDGSLTRDDQPLAGVELELRDGITGDSLLGSLALPGSYPADEQIRTVTDERGFYEFKGLPKGNYAVYELHPAGYTDGIDTPGTTNGVAINPVPEDSDDIFIETVIQRLSKPPRNDAIVLIALPPGVHSQLNNFSEVLAEESPPYVPSLPVPTPELEDPVGPELPAPYVLERELAPVPLNELRYIADGSYTAKNNTWHLSIIDGGQPRIAQRESPTKHLFPASLWQQHRLIEASWELPKQDGPQSHLFGSSVSIPIAGDFNGDGTAEIGVFDDGHWYIDINANGRWDGQDLWAKLGHDGDIPVVGDWDGDGKDDIGVFGRSWPGDPRALRAEAGLPDMDNVPDGSKKNMPPRDEEATLGRRVMKLTARGQLRADVIDHVFLYGAPGDLGVVGDWNGDGIDTIGVYRHGFWLLDVDGNGQWSAPDEAARFGQRGDIPLVGDFNGDGIDDLAVIQGDRIVVDSNRNRKLDSADLVIECRGDAGEPVVGKWNGTARDEIAWFRRLEDEQITVANREQAQ